ncbi:MAG: undecaprenyl/decaprenyl-phosphate alpha-N-acetylglucosaminyl 1-phosphate transferase, partial [Bacteroidetes bacterium]|nr:undecaprenyl/decaprenyl-phosphate alpha-N-acetylglucosaminyl 1-phosphate transferase [Bacteroidota bacterium]
KMNFIYIAILLSTSTLLSFLSNFLVLNFAKTLGIRNMNNVSIRWSNESKPSLGGVSMYVVFLFTGLILAITQIEFIEHNQIEYMGLFIAASMAFFMGIADDAYDTKPWMKLAIQVTCGVVLALTNNYLIVSPSMFFNQILTVVWVVVLMNSLNMLDNMDGITATICVTVLIGCLSVYVFKLGWNFNIWTILILTTIGTLIGFLFFNFHPSKMFMGDGGSQFIGLIIAFFTGKFLFGTSEMVSSYNWQGVILAMVCLTPAAADTLTVVFNRIKGGKSPMIGGKDHTTHHLVYAGYSDKKVWLVFLILGSSSVLAAIGVLYLLKEHFFYAALLGITWFLAVFFILYRNTVLFPNPNK